MRAAIVIVTTLIVVAAIASRPRQSNEARPEGAPRVVVGDLAILLIDAQTDFVDMMAGEPEPVLVRLEQLLLLAEVDRVPLLATFECPDEENLELPPRLEKVFPEHGRRVAKRYFDLTREDKALQAVAAMGRRQLAVAGAETDVCILQSVLGLLARGYEVFLIEDCIFSNEGNVEPALARLRAAGAIPTTLKTLYFEITQKVGPPVVDDPDLRARLRARRDQIRGPYQYPPFRGHRR